MKLRFRQRMFSWFDSYDICDEGGQTVYTVRGQLSWGHCLKIFDAGGRDLGMVQEKILTLLPKLGLYEEGQYLVCIRRELSLIRPRYEIDFNQWQVQGSVMEWNYTIYRSGKEAVARVSKELLHLTDTYVLDIVNQDDAFHVLMFVLAMDADKCSNGD